MRFVRGLSDPPEDLDIEALREAVAVDAVEIALLFGSFAADDSTPLSDLDVAVRFTDGTAPDDRRVLLDSLTTRIIDATGFEAVDLIDIEAVGPDLGYQACSTGVVLRGDPDRVATLEGRLLSKKLDFMPVKRRWSDALLDRLRGGSFGRR